jgi:HEAT repeat protein
MLYKAFRKALDLGARVLPGLAIVILMGFALFLVGLGYSLIAPLVLLVALLITLAPDFSQYRHSFAGLLLFLLWCQVAYAAFAAPALAAGFLINRYFENAYNYPLNQLGHMALTVCNFFAGISGLLVSILFAVRDTRWRLKQARELRNLPTSKARSAAIGLAEFRGQAMPAPEPGKQPDYDSKIMINHQATSLKPFHLEDESGKILVDPRGALFRSSAALHFSSILREIRLVPNWERGEMLDVSVRPGDEIYVLGSVQRNPDAPRDAVDSGALVVKPNVERKLAGPFWRLLYGVGRTAAWRTGNENIFFLTNSSEHTASRLIRRGMIISWVWAAIWILSSLWLLQEEIPRLLWNENLTFAEIMQDTIPDERRMILVDMLSSDDGLTQGNALNALWQLRAEIEKGPGCCPELIPGLLRAMKGRQHVRDFAAFALSHINEGKERAVPGLLALANDLEPDIRFHSIMALGQMKQPPTAAIPVIKASLADPDRIVRDGACHALASYKETATEAFSCLGKLTADPDKTIRREAISAMTRLKVGPEIALPFYTQLLGGDDTTFSYFAAIGLLHQGKDAAPALAALVRALGRQSNERVFVIQALGKIGPDASDAADKLAEILKQGGDQERENAAEALGLIGSLDAIPALEEAAANDRQNRVREHADAALKRIRKKMEGPAPLNPCQGIALADENFNCLKDLFMEGNFGSRHAAISAMAQLKVGPELAVPFFTPLLESEDKPFSYFAAMGLFRQGKDAAPALENLVRALDRDRRERIYIIQTLGKIGPGASIAVSKLIELLKVGGEQERSNAANALGFIGSEEAIPALEEAAAGDTQNRLRTQAQWAVKKILENTKRQ